jgi:creatinine amidohydrolase
MMAVRPELVNMEHAVSQVPEKVIRINEKTGLIWDIKELTETGATGDPTKATVEKGKQMLDILVDLVAGAIEDMNHSGWNYSK